MKGVHIEMLEQVARWFNSEHFPVDRVIVQQGDPGDRFYILVRGKVDVLRSDGERSQIVGRLQDGDCFGEMALLSNQPRNATVKTLTDCVCLSLTCDTFNRLLDREPELRRNIQELAVARGAQ
jgi:ATP-binding cassette subfamily B protein